MPDQPNVCQNDIPSNASPTLEQKAHSTEELVKLQRLVGKKNASPFPHIKHHKKRAYATAYALMGMHGRACDLAGISRNTPGTPQWRNDPELQEALAQAVLMVGQSMEDEVYRRAVEGVMEPTGWYKGEPGGYVRRFSDTLLMFRLKAIHPEKYAERHDIRSTSTTVNILVVQDLMSRRELPQSVVRRLADGESVDAVMLSWAADLKSQGTPVPVGLLGPGGDSGTIKE